MLFTPTAIPDVIVIEPRVHKDERGFFYESYQKKLFAENGITADFVQDNHVRSCRGAVRALHFQRPPYTQGKLVRAIQGSVFDVVVDLRKASAYYGKHVGVLLSAENQRMLWVPEGFAHGYCSLDTSEVLYKVTHYYSKEHDGGILWSDPALGIVWPALDVPYVVCEKDRKLPRLADLKDVF
ncbi:MAG: dTDP-4-dehydrorhamnose 3,5-epimerase [Candidatus Omnitrophica bacterium]|nr:dTDP-4-dehydrorhamnose 3,5-epimerase [Candidatus Omnitrophota bacterium]